KASVNLLDFGKTGVLEPGASETITMTIPLENLASYDSACIKTANGGYVLEAGEYTVSIRKNSHEVIDSKTFTLASDKLYDGGRPSDKAAVENRFAAMEGTDKTYISRKDHFANLAEAVAPHAALELSKDESKVVQSWAYGNRNYDPTDYDDPNDVMPTLGAKNGLTLADLAGKPYDDPQWEQLLDQLTIQDMITLINTAGWNTAAIESVGKVATSEFDGPSGYSNYLTGTMGTQFCTEVLLAQTWNKALAEKVGDAIAQEFASANSFGWYGPAMNLHRSAFSGRNFEYYSEDGTLSGLLASAEVKGAAKFGVYPYLKHFAANDQETNRCAFLLTYMTEQNLRENVLRPFETVVKNFDFDHYVLGIMTSYNFLGPVPVISNKALLTDVLRGEWGFIGSVISDYNGSYGYQISDAAVRAGNDLMLGQGMAASNEFTDIDSATLVLAMRRACKNVLYNTANSGYYADAAAAAAALEASTSENAVDKMMGTVNLCAGLGLGLVEILVLVRWLLKKKKAKAA
ncbi:MAG: fibronectin type III-like domain-contianing protein, partial [Clostridia bacterium]|nr:fibronectin type III-like domain-contianing protein [Clostridia bacterium]